MPPIYIERSKKKTQAVRNEIVYMYTCIRVRTPTPLMPIPNVLYSSVFRNHKFIYIIYGK